MRRGKGSRSRTFTFVIWITVGLPLIVQCAGGPSAIERPPDREEGLRYGVTRRQCSGLAIPHDWIWIASETNTLAGCGDYPHNVALIRYVAGASAGSREEACSGTPLPPGWDVVGYRTEPNRCDADYPDNVAIIERAEE